MTFSSREVLQLNNIRVDQREEPWNKYSQENLIEFLVQSSLSYIC